MAPPPARSVKPVQKDSDEQSSNSLWVGNLAPDVTDSDLMNLFAKYGALDSVTTYSSRSYAFLYFKLAEDAAAAKTALQGKFLRGSALKIEFARPAKPCQHLWVGGISPIVTKEQLEEEFLKFGKIEDFKFFRDRNTAFVEFYKLDDASEAVKNMNGKRIGGEQIRVDYLRSQSSRREQLADFRDSRESQFPVTNIGVKRPQYSQPPGAQKDGQPSNVLWVGYPPSVQMDEQMLHNAMILFGEIERIKSFPSRHYSFVEFRSVDEARRAKEGLQGRLFNDPRITIMFSSSGQVGFYSEVKGLRPEMYNEELLGLSQMEILDHHSVGISRLLPHGSNYGQNLQARPFGPQGEFDPLLPGAELNDLGSLRVFRDSNSNMPMAPNWRKPSSPASGILPSPASRTRLPMRSISSGWDVLDANQHQRELKRSRIDAKSSIDDESFPSRKTDRRGLGLERAHGLSPGDGDALALYGNVQGRRSFSPVGSRGRMGRPLIDHDYIWRGIIAKGGTLVCNARCVPIGKGLESELPEIVNCSARTGLDMLTKHYAEAIGFDIVFFLPDSEDDFASYTEFLRYLGSKNRAGVAKFDDGTTLFLVPPSDFLTKVLDVAGPERLYGVVLKLPQQVSTGSPLQPQLSQPLHPSHYIDKHQLPPPEADFSQISQREEHVMPLDYNKVLRKELKLPPKSFYPSKAEAATTTTISQDYASNNTVAVSQAGVSLTPELIATLTSFLPGNAQSSGSESGQPLSGSSTAWPSFSTVAADKGTSSQGWSHDNQVSGNTSHLQMGNQFNSQVQFQPQYQPFPSVSHPPGHSANSVPASIQVPDSVANFPHQGATISTSYTMPSQSGQIVLSPQASQQYQHEVPHGIQKGYGIVHGTDVSGSYNMSVIQQPNNATALSSQVQGANYMQTQSGGTPLSAQNVNWELSSQGHQFQQTLAGAGQGTSESEVDKNQRYQSTLQFAANLLQQLQQQQTNMPTVQGTGYQQ